VSCIRKKDFSRWAAAGVLYEGIAEAIVLAIVLAIVPALWVNLLAD
jgi:hypothetical protein